MMGSGTEWRTIRPGTVEELPDAPGVVVLGSLVRNVLFVADASEGIRAAVRSALSRPQLRGQARCLLVEPTDAAAERQAEILAAYRAAHGGELPPAQSSDPPAVAGDAESHAAETLPPLTIVSRREPARPAAHRAHPGRYAEGFAPTFLRVRTVA
jgi:hypothetical protein